MRVLVTGAEGQLGQDVVKALKSQGIDFLGADKDKMDITLTDMVHQVFEEYNPDVVVHCAAYTAVDKAETEKELCYNINVIGTRNLAMNCKKFNAKMVYISTDYVFDGLGEEPFQANQQPDPVNYYGQTKYEGEQEVKKLLSDYFILRISWAFGVNGHNFVKTMLKLGREREEVSVVSDQIGSPTYTTDVAKLIVEMIKTDKYGIYHMTNSGYCSWSEFASTIFQQAGINCKVHPILTKDYPTAAKRPLNSRMVTEDTFKQFGLKQRIWKEALNDYLVETFEINKK